jgi:CRP/FNR family transcriptional regulator
MSLPRVLTLGTDGILRMNPPEEIERLRYNGKRRTALTVKADAELAVEGVGGNSIELTLEVMAPEAKQYGVKVCCSPDGKEQILHILGPGEPFGEAPVFAGQSFPAHAVALEDCRLVFLPRDDFVDLVTRNPSLALNLLAVLSKRLREFTRMVDSLSLKEVPGRLAGHLLLLSRKQANGDELELELSKTQLASLLGTIPETLSRILKKLQKAGYIRIEGARITIVDRERLAELAEIGKF